MSSITGIFYRDGRSVEPELIKKMNDKLSHRGPDGSSTWFDGPIGLGHQMLWTTQESLHETLPLEENGLVITADARIDNRKELSEELSIEDKEHISDSYFILKAYHKWGETCPEKLLGDFAFAIWDKNEQKLFCARDHMGVKPFYYYLNNDIFVFGTEIKALFEIDEIPHELNEKKIIFHLMPLNLDKKLTFYKKIFVLTSAHSLKISQTQNKIKKYWELDPKSKIILESDEDYIDAFREIFKSAIECRLRSAYPIGFQLSGGLDSSSIVCMARKILNADKKDYTPNSTIINTFSYVFDDFPQVDEREYIKKVVNKGGINPYFLFCDQVSPLEEIETIMFHQDQPFYSAVTISISSKLFKKMHEKDIRLVLTGHGGDQVIYSGYMPLNEFAYNLQLKKFIKELYQFSKNYDVNIFKYFFNNFIFPLIPKNLQKIILKKTLSQKNANCFIINESFANKFGGKKHLKKNCAQQLKCNTSKECHYSSITKISNQSIMELLDKTVSASYIEPRYPFFDKRMVEFCYAIPSEMKFKFGWNRYILRAGMNTLLPKEIQWRPKKKYFTSFFQKNFLLFEKNTLEDMLYYEKEIIGKYVDLDVLNNIYLDYISGKPRFPIYLWIAMILFIWLKEKNKK